MERETVATSKGKAQTMISDKNVQESDTTEDDSSNEDGIKN
jgi:hypothetical protein